MKLTSIKVSVNCKFKLSNASNKVCIVEKILKNTTIRNPSLSLDLNPEA